MEDRIILKSLGILVLILIALPLAATDLDVEYLEGSLEYREGRDSWTAVEIGDIIPSGRSIRLSDRGYAELTAGARTITLTRDGVYDSADLIGDAPEQANFRQVLGSKFASLLKRKDKSQGYTVAAVRGAEADGGNYVSWEDDSSDYLADGIAALESGDLQGAKGLFEEGTIWESGAVQRECAFRLGVVQQLMGDPRNARRTLVAISPEPTDRFIDEYTVVMGTLYIESSEFADADRVLSSYLQDNPRGEAAQAAYLLQAYSKEGQGDAAASRANLRKAVELGPNTEIGQAASEMLP
ncbi:MAG: hypothetical protein MI717_09280 [Spirochaetales bacterium]|nr:hypothetical protein [Spirochaetales bacterium]